MIEYGTDALGDIGKIGMMIALTTVIGSALVIHRAKQKRINLCARYSVITLLLLVVLWISYAVLMEDASFFSDNFNLSIGFWIPLFVHLVCFIRSIAVSGETKMVDQ